MKEQEKVKICGRVILEYGRAKNMEKRKSKKKWENVVMQEKQKQKFFRAGNMKRVAIVLTIVFFFVFLLCNFVSDPDLQSRNLKF